MYIHSSGSEGGLTREDLLAANVESMEVDSVPHGASEQLPGMTTK